MNIQHFRFFIATSEMRIWGDVFAESEQETFEMVAALFPWLRLLDAPPASVGNILHHQISWEDNRPDQTKKGIVQYNSWHQHLSLDRKDK